MGKGRHHVQAGLVGGPVKGAAHLFAIDSDGRPGITFLREISAEFVKKLLEARGGDQTKQPRKCIVTRRSI